MADAQAPSETATSGPTESKLPLILGLLNTLALVAAAGTFAYTRILFKRPEITESQERAKIQAQLDKPPAPEVPELVSFEPRTLNLKSDRGSDTAPAAPGLPGIPRYAKIGFAIEIRDTSFKDRVEAARPQILDLLLQHMGRRAVNEINTVQGRYQLKTQLIESFNGLIAQEGELPIVTNLFFAEFILQ